MATTPAVSEASAPSSDGAQHEVFLWRDEQFRELGFSRPQAAELALSEADLGQARYLIRTGCAPELALSILR
jgi:hypothetical protein